MSSLLDHDKRGDTPLATFILIHGGWAGAWQWERVVPRLRAMNHTVYTPSLTGLGEKRHLASPEVNVSTHVCDVASVFEENTMNDCVLVGFSYGGMVATGVARKYTEQIEKLIYLDAFFPVPGQSLFDIFGKKVSKSLLAMTDAFGDGWLLPFFDAYDSRLTDQPKQTGTEKIYYYPERLRKLQPVYTECTKKDSSWTFTPILQRIADERRNAGWDVREFPSGHFPMNSHPAELAQHLNELQQEKRNLQGTL